MRLPAKTFVKMAYWECLHKIDFYTLNLCNFAGNNKITTAILKI